MNGVLVHDSALYAGHNLADEMNFGMNHGISLMNIADISMLHIPLLILNMYNSYWIFYEGNL